MKATRDPANRCTGYACFRARRAVAIPMRRPRTSTAKGSSDPAPARCGPDGEPQGRTMVRRHHLVGMPGRTHALYVRDLGCTGEPDPPTRLVRPPAQVHVLGVHEIRLVEPAQLLERAATGQEARAGNPVGLDGFGTFGDAGVVALGEAVLRIEQRKQRMARRVEEGRKASHRWIDRPVVGMNLRPDQSPRRVCLEDPAQRVDGPRMDMQIGVGDKHPRRRRRAAR